MTESTTLTFNDTPLEIINDNSGLWIRGYQVGCALGYTQPLQKIIQLYERYKGEFSPSMTKIMKVKTEGGTQSIRVFSLRGVHLLAMFAKTEKAKHFRQWVLNILENHIDEKKHGTQSPSFETDDMEKLHTAKETVEFLLDRLKLHHQLITTQSMVAIRTEEEFAETLAVMRDKIGDQIVSLLERILTDMRSVLGDHPNPLPLVEAFLSRHSAALMH